MAEDIELVVHCPTCYSTKFRLSRMRPEDRFQRILFRYPVRCRQCSARLYVNRAYANYLRRHGQISPKAGEKVEENSTSDL